AASAWPFAESGRQPAAGDPEQPPVEQAPDAGEPYDWQADPAGVAPSPLGPAADDVPAASAWPFAESGRQPAAGEPEQPPDRASGVVGPYGGQGDDRTPRVPPALRPAVDGLGVRPVAGQAADPQLPAVRNPVQLPAQRTVFGEGGVRWAPELPPGWVAAAAEGEPAAEVVGGGPPTYAPEPTAWPEADPDRLDGLVADTVLDGAQYGGLTVRTVSVRGDSARFRGQPRRDALLTARFGTGDDALLMVAMASGARAADDAHRAAQDAVQWIAGAVGRSRERLAGDLRAARRGSLKSGLHRLTDRCYGRLRARGEDLGLDEGTYTASLRCLLLPADPACPVRLFFGVGDGGLFRIRSGAWQDLDPAPQGADVPFRFRATVAQPGDALLMCSAGLAEPLRGEPALATHLAERWGGGRVPGLPAYLADTQTRVKGYADDRTAVTVWDA
ncbi:protein phosphatase 2C domain-containing protein, partial [Streptomyces sp. IBSBF 2435]|uniref:protein phosphatase 2C domain-containing protein n=1 Tax=Streptomyces sp. IBSBF 2435 TaxID=2903531 RepID=UPI003FA68C90